MRAQLEPAFLEGFLPGRRFALWVKPPGGVAPLGAILCIQPFGDEANLARRVLVAQASRLALLGWTTLILDPYGTGDSDGATSQASLASWRADLLRASRLARERAPGAFVLWGTRLGTLLAAELAIALDQLASAIVFWQPAPDGASLLDPLLKLARLGSMARVDRREPDAENHSRATTANAAVDAPPVEGGMPGRAGAGHAMVNLAGYRLPMALIENLRSLDMQPPSLGEGANSCPVLMLGVQRVAQPGSAAPKALSELAGRWLAEGYLTSLRVVQGEPFWSSLEPSMPLAAFAQTESFLETIDGSA